MPKKKTSKKKISKTKTSLGRRGLWKGAISFGLVNVPVQLFSARQGEELSFNKIDKRDHSRIGYKQINKSTGKEVDASNIIKGYEYEKGEYVLLTDADFDRANVKATRTIDIEDFVKLDDVDVLFFDKPYYVVPQKGGEKGYALLRRVLQKTGKAGIAKVVISRKQHLAALIPKDDYIVLEILRFADEVLEIHEVEKLDDAVTKAKISEREVAVAEQLVDGMTSSWEPDKYSDTYRRDIMNMIHAKIKSGKTATVDTSEPAEEEEVEESASNVVDLTALLRKSLSAAGAKKPKTRERRV